MRVQSMQMVNVDSTDVAVDYLHGQGIDAPQVDVRVEHYVGTEMVKGHRYSNVSGSSLARIRTTLGMPDNAHLYTNKHIRGDMRVSWDVKRESD